MKQAKGNIKDHFLILTIKVLILSLFIFSVLSGILKILVYGNSVFENGIGLESYLNILKETSIFRPAIILLIPLMGIFINKKTGWILIQSYFYFLISNLAFTWKYIEITNNTSIFINISIFLIFSIPIILMNKSNVAKLFYGIEKTQLIGINVIASIIGMSITIVLAIIKSNQIL